MDEDSANLINAVTGSELKYEVKGGRVDVCTAIDEMRQESRNEGRREGRLEGRREGALEMLSGLVKDGILTLADAAKRAGLSPAEFQSRTAEFLCSSRE